MNPTITSPRSPFICDASRLIGRFVADADLRSATAEKFLAQLVKARADAAAAEQEFLNTLAGDDARAFADAKRRVENLAFGAIAIEDAGGVVGIRHRALHVSITFNTLAKGFAERSDALGKLMPKALKALGEARAAATEAGQHNAIIEFLPEIAHLRGTVEQIIADRNNAQALREWCLRWTPETRNQNFSDLHGALEAPLPA